jgi:ABC-type bacteriocin/lantibiotic exporter with double-glycine peptidase domain
MRGGELVSRLTTDVGRVQDGVVALATSFLPDAVMLLAEHPFLDGFNLRITAGETVCLIDGTDVSTCDQHSVRNRFAYVPQDPWLLDATVAENIAFGNPKATHDDVLEAGRAALVDEFIGQLPHGYDTPLGESGVRLSGGQRRRVAIARAAVSNAPMVLLDEPTASLDPRSAKAVIDAIRTATTNRTVLVVTHDRDLAAIADRVVTLTSPAPRGWPGVHRITQLQQTEGR